MQGGGLYPQLELDEEHCGGLEDLWAPETRLGQLWRIRGLGVERVTDGNPFEITTFEDIDGDGRRDQVTFGPYQAVVSIPAGTIPFDGSFFVHGPTLVAYQRAGKFVFESTKFVRKSVTSECQPVKRSCGTYLMGSDFFAIACARVMGENAIALGRRCSLSERSADDFEPRGMWRKWLRTEPPVRADGKRSR